MISAAVVSVVCLLLGLVISYLYATPTGASIVLCNMAAFFIYAVIAKIKGLD
jgi:zinc transport system permease protein